jgi:FkbM family methyltransferase
MKLLRKMIWDLSASTSPFRGKERLVALISRPKSVSQIKISRQDVIWSLEGHDLNEFYIATRNSHSPLLFEKLSQEIEQNRFGIFWDIGANLGATSLPLIRRFHDLRAVLFEPSADVAGRLIRNLSNNPELSERSTVMNIALSDSIGISNFYVSSESFNSGVAGLGHSHNRLMFAVCVQSYTGDALIEQKICPAPNLIKVDVEGFELEVFEGLKKTLSQNRPTIFFEHSLYRLKERNQKENQVTDFLESVGYSIHRLSDNKKIAAKDLDRDDDFIARAVV